MQDSPACLKSRVRHHSNQTSDACKMNPIADKIAMLLSTDWFLDQWNEMGMISDSNARIAMQAKCREIVEQIFEGATDYWQVSFEDVRIRSTQSLLLAATRECKLEACDVELLMRIVNQTPAEVDEANSISLLESLTQLLLSGGGDEEAALPGGLVVSIEKSFSYPTMERADIVVRCLNSDTDWDKKIRGLTPDLPDLLGDFFLSLYKQMHHFRQYWVAVVEKISTEERLLLLEWYRVAALKLTGRDLHMPQWMEG